MFSRFFLGARRWLPINLLSALLVALSLSIFTPSVSLAAADGSTNVVTTVLCSIIYFLKHDIGLPGLSLLTIGTCILAMLGRMPYAVVIAMFIFVAAFFGSDQIIGIFSKAGSAQAAKFTCDDYVNPASGG